MDERIYLKIKVKSLAEEARIIRRERQKKHPFSIKEGLYRHNVDVIRPEVRSAHLAYGFFKGRAYGVMENRAKTEPNWDRIEKLVKKYGSHLRLESGENWYHVYDDRREERRQQKNSTDSRFAKWIKEAKQYFQETQAASVK